MSSVVAGNGQHQTRHIRCQRSELVSVDQERALVIELGPAPTRPHALMKDIVFPQTITMAHPRSDWKRERYARDSNR